MRGYTTGQIERINEFEKNLREPSLDELAEWHEWLFIEQAHKFAACSSLIFRSGSLFEINPYKRVCTIPVRFTLKNVLNYKLEKGYLSKILYKHRNNEYYPFEHFAFLCTSTFKNAHVNKEMRELGFYQTEPTYNEKNKTDVVFSMIEIPKLLENIKE